jgi:hypothetical protein
MARVEPMGRREADQRHEQEQQQAVALPTALDAGVFDDAVEQPMGVHDGQARLAEQPEAGQEVDQEGDQHLGRQAQARKGEQVEAHAEFVEGQGAERGEEKEQDAAIDPDDQETADQVPAADPDGLVVGPGGAAHGGLGVVADLEFAEGQLGEDAAQEDGQAPGEEGEEGDGEETAV